MVSFVFTAVWRLPGAPRRVAEVLADVPGYVEWWPQIRAVTASEGEGEARVRARSLLPVPLRLTLVRERADIGDDGADLRVGLHGDLEGFARFRVGPGPAPGTALARYEQQVRVSAAHLAIPARIAPWVARGNHAWMMRGGERGLTRALRDGGGDAPAAP